MKSKKIIVIAGPTAVGKTALSVGLAQHFDTEIISADSRQCFRELNIGVAKPSHTELSSVKHHFINSHSIHNNVHAILFEQFALNAAETIFSKHDIAIMVGGTGLYIRAFCDGLDEIPEIAPGIREQIIDGYRKSGIEWLQQKVRDEDPAYYSTGEVSNPQRLMRALEVKYSTGKSIRTFQRKEKVQRPFDILKLALQLPKEQLHKNINQRADKMMADGLLDEVKSLVPFRDLPALRTVGYSELFDFLDGNIELNEAVDLIKKNTRHYAKRQLTWFRKDREFQWFDPSEKQKIIDLCQEFE